MILLRLNSVHLDSRRCAAHAADHVPMLVCCPVRSAEVLPLPPEPDEPGPVESWYGCMETIMGCFLSRNKRMRTGPTTAAQAASVHQGVVETLGCRPIRDPDPRGSI